MGSKMGRLIDHVKSGVRAAAVRIALAAMALGVWAQTAMAEQLIGQPTDKALGLQPAASVLKHDAHFFHDSVLMPIIAAISIFVLLLLASIVVRYNRKANPVPAKFTHNTLLEVIWTVVPVGILVVIAVFSFPLLYKYDNMPKPDMKKREAWSVFMGR